jgi:hypothetical protein
MFHVLKQVRLIFAEKIKRELIIMTIAIFLMTVIEVFGYLTGKKK